MRSWLTYTALRLLLFACVAVVLALLGLPLFPLVLLALLVSSVLSLFMLRPQREALVAAQARRVQARSAEREELRARLDGAPQPGGPDEPDQPKHD